MPALPSERHRPQFAAYFPEPAAAYCFKLWQEYRFQFSVKRPRRSLLGDYRYHDGKHAISVNADLNPYAFLVTYLHEVAHMKTRLARKKKVLPHGPEWKNSFKILMQPLLSEQVFPEPILQAVRNYMENPRASSCADPVLLKALGLNSKPEHHAYLSDLPEGSLFRYEGRIFRRLQKRRTRIACRSVHSGTAYLFAGTVAVEPISESPQEQAEFAALFAAEKDENSLLKPLKLLPDNSLFSYNHKQFVKNNLRRTRVLCTCQATGQKWLLSAEAGVKPL